MSPSSGVFEEEDKVKHNSKGMSIAIQNCTQMTDVLVCNKYTNYPKHSRKL